MTKIKLTFSEILYQLCAVSTLIILTWSIVIPYLDYEKVSSIAQAIILFITAIGSIGLYLPIGTKIAKIYEEIKKQEQKQNDK